jgi:hypothetical protein
VNKRLDFNSLAAIQYMGMAGITSSCLNALFRLICFGDKITDARLLTCTGSNNNTKRHCFLLIIEPEEFVAIKSEFSSGYLGEGPRGLSIALTLLDSYEIDVNEYFVERELLDRVDASCLLISDIERLSSKEGSGLLSSFVKYKYLYEEHYEGSQPNLRFLKDKLPVEMSLGIIDDRILDLAIQFKQNPDSAIMSGYRRLEDIIRKRTNLAHEHGEKLFSKAFIKDDSILHWEKLHPAENKGRASLFSATYMGYRNRRAHKESGGSMSNDLREFLLLNQLYCLEAAAVERLSNNHA